MDEGHEERYLGQEANSWTPSRRPSPMRKRDTRHEAVHCNVTAICSGSSLRGSKRG